MVYFGPIWVGFHTCGGSPIREGPSLIRNLEVHHKFGRLWCGCCEGAGSSVKSVIELTMSSTNLGSCPICSCKMLCLGFTPFNVAFMFSFSIHVTFCCQMPHSWKVTIGYVYCVWHFSSSSYFHASCPTSKFHCLCWGGFQCEILFLLPQNKLPLFSLKKCWRSSFSSGWKCSTMATYSLTINAQMTLATFYASFIFLIQQFKSWFNFKINWGICWVGSNHIIRRHMYLLKPLLYFFLN